MTPSSGALAGLHVIDASRHPAGQYGARLLADNGAVVELHEAADDDPVIGRLAHRRGERTDIPAAIFRHLNVGKRLPAPADRLPDRLDLDGPDGPAIIDRLAAADVAIVADPAVADAVVSADGGGLVALVTEFGRHGPYARWRGSELVHQALSGSMAVNGLQDRPPLYGCGLRAYHSAGSYLYLSVTAAVAARLAAVDGPARRQANRLVEVTVHESAASMEQNFSGQWNYNRTVPVRDDMARPRGRARCADGWVIYFLRPEHWPVYCRMFGRPELVDDPRFTPWTNLSNRWREAEGELRRSATHRTVADVVAEAGREGLIMAPMLEPDDQFDDPHLAARSYWHHLEWGGEPTRALGPVFRMSHTPLVAPSPPVAIGDTEPQPRWLARTDGVGGSDPARPLAGVRVLDLTVAWAGPMAGRHLACLGAEVIKLEGPSRVDTWRGEVVDPPRTHLYPDGDPGARPYDRSCWFNSQNHEKASVVIDTKQEEGLALARRLAGTCDIVLVNYTPGALDRMGLGYDALRGDNPGLIVVEMPAFGTGGPQSGLRGLGPTMEAMAGIGTLIGYPDSGPLGSGSAYLDPIGGLHGAAACVTALVARARLGVGQHVEVAQREAAMHWIGDILLAADAGAETPTAVGNDRAELAPHGAYRTGGFDEWIAIEAADDEAFAALCRELAAPELAEDERFDSPERRWTNRRLLDDEITARTRVRHRHELASRLQVAGVRAAPINDGADLTADPHLAAAGWFTPLDHDDVGRFSYPGLPYVLDGRRLVPERGSATYGSDSRRVLAEVGVDDGEYERLLAADVVAETPIEAR